MGACSPKSAPYQPEALPVSRPGPTLLEAPGGVRSAKAEAHTIQHAQVIPTFCGGLCSDYRLDARRLGEGTYGTVCRGTHCASRAERAIKTVRHSGPKSVKALQGEIATMQAMDHPNVVKLFEAYHGERASYLVMELCEGGELLDKIIAAGHFSEQGAATVMTQILRAVRYVHSKNIAHRDIKPQNFLLASKDKLESNTIKLIDFGFSCPCRPGSVLRTRAGTALYVAPQVLQGRYDRQCDLWSTGVTLFALLSGRAPFTGRSDLEIFEKVKKGRVSFEGRTWGRVSEDAKDLVLQLIRFNPKERLTADGALRHRWITRATPAAPKADLDMRVVQRLRSFRVRNKLERAVLQIVARQLSEDKVKDLRAAFEALDANADGKLTMEELSSGLARAGLEKRDLDLHCIMAMADANGSGEIDYSEFLHATLDRRRCLTDDALFAAFRVFDRNGDGHISEDELRFVLCSSSDAPEDCGQPLLQLLSDVDVSGDGIIDFAEFKEMMHAWDSESSGDASPVLERAALGGA